MSVSGPHAVSSVLAHAMENNLILLFITAIIFHVVIVSNTFNMETPIVLIPTCF